MILNRNYLTAVQKLYEHNKVIVDNIINTKFDGAENKNLKGIIELIPLLTDGCVITTNFDKLLERVFEEKADLFKVLCMVYNNIAVLHRNLFKVHVVF